MSAFDRPFPCEPAEARLTRAMVAALVMYCAVTAPAFTSQPHPVGLARFVDLTFLSTPAIRALLLAALAAAGALYAAGRLTVPALGFMLAMSVGPRTLANSQGATGHSHQIVALVTLGLLAGHLAHRRAPGFGAAPSGPGADATAFHYARQTIAATYVLAALSKLFKSGGRWLLDAPNLALQIVKTDDQRACTFGDAASIGAMDGWALWIAAHPGTTRVVLGSVLVLEAFAFLALMDRRAASLIGAALLLTHAGVRLLMGLKFLDNQLMLLIFFVGVPGLAVAAWRRFGRSDPSPAGAAAP